MQFDNWNDLSNLLRINDDEFESCASFQTFLLLYLNEEKQILCFSDLWNFLMTESNNFCKFLAFDC